MIKQHNFFAPGCAPFRNNLTLRDSEYFVQKNGLSESADSATSISSRRGLDCDKFFGYKILLHPYNRINGYV